MFPIKLCLILLGIVIKWFNLIILVGILYKEEKMYLKRKIEQYLNIYKTIF